MCMVYFSKNFFTYSNCLPAAPILNLPADMVLLSAKNCGLDPLDGVENKEEGEAMTLGEVIGVFVTSVSIVTAPTLVALPIIPVLPELPIVLADSLLPKDLWLSSEPFLALNSTLLLLVEKSIVSALPDSVFLMIPIVEESIFLCTCICLRNELKIEKIYNLS